MENGPLFVNQGINFRFPECKVRASPEPIIKWKRFFWNFPKGRYSAVDGHLNISRVQYDDEGFYICEAENSLGKLVMCKIFSMMMKDFIFVKRRIP